MNEFDWPEISFSKAFEINPRYALQRGREYPFIEMASVGENTGHISSIANREYTGSGAKFGIGDTVFARITPCLENGKIAQVKNLPSEVGFGSTEFIVIRGREGITDTGFAYYVAISPQVKDYAIQRMTGTSGRQRVPTEVFDNLYIPLPPLEEQRAIANILGSLDDKIEANRRMNETLEATARAIFKSWFVDFDPVHSKSRGETPLGMDAETAALFPDTFEDSELGPIPSGWRVGHLDDVTEFVIGGDWGKSDETEVENQPVFCIRGADIPSLQEGGLGQMPIRYLKPSSLTKRGLRHGDIVIEISGGSPTQQTGRVVLATDALLARLTRPLSFSNFCRLVRLKSDISSHYIYIWLTWLYVSNTFFQYETGTTGIKNLAFTTFSGQHPLIIPSVEVLNVFQEVVASLFEKHQANGGESEELAKTRDALLPKLVSGEVRVGDTVDV